MSVPDTQGMEEKTEAKLYALESMPIFNGSLRQACVANIGNTLATLSGTAAFLTEVPK